MQLSHINEADLHLGRNLFGTPRQKEFFERLELAYDSGNIGVMIGRDPADRSKFTEKEIKQLDNTLKTIKKYASQSTYHKIVLNTTMAYIAMVVIFSTILMGFGLSVIYGLHAYEMMTTTTLQFGIGVATFSAVRSITSKLAIDSALDTKDRTLLRIKKDFKKHVMANNVQKDFERSLKILKENPKAR